ncbi:MAG: hypothetical protein R2854_15260 [Caldilineaceae bacterium]
MLWLAIIGAVWLAVWAVLHLREQSSWEAGAVDQTRVAPDVLAGGVLFWLILGFFWRTVSGDVYQPADGGDLVSFLFPTYRFAAQQLSQGVLPLWNPHLYGGAPFISDIQAGFLYPVNAVLFLLRPDFDYKTMQWLAIGHLYWAGLGVYVLLRVLQPGGAAWRQLGGAAGRAGLRIERRALHSPGQSQPHRRAQLAAVDLRRVCAGAGPAQPALECGGRAALCRGQLRGPCPEQLLHRPRPGRLRGDPVWPSLARSHRRGRAARPWPTCWWWPCSRACSRHPFCCPPWR